MTPEELNRTIDFIVQSQARLAAAQEQDREDRVHFDKRLANLLEVQTQLLESQTRRLDQHSQRHDEHSQRLDEYQKENKAAQKRHEELHEEFLEFMREAREWRQ